MIWDAYKANTKLPLDKVMDFVHDALELATDISATMAASAASLHALQSTLPAHQHPRCA